MERPDIGMDYPVLDCPEPAALAGFYEQLLGWRTIRAEADWHVIAGVGGQRLAFQLAPDFRPIDWPAVGVGVHLDLTVESLDLGEEWAINLGAERITGIAEHPDFRVYRDPVGHYFCLCRQT
ncbi:hypothetical protein ABH922_000921 [Rhodococcus sp. 27YEA15]|uniref:VOC family protein n=1 Tax=Rhodococcus sp. 27YEA15 TaxID=3156259 RepID=UPI003C7D1FC7